MSLEVKLTELAQTVDDNKSDVETKLATKVTTSELASQISSSRPGSITFSGNGNITGTTTNVIEINAPSRINLNINGSTIAYIDSSGMHCTNMYVNGYKIEIA